MSTKPTTRHGRVATAIGLGVVLVLAFQMLTPADGQAASQSLNVDLASKIGPATGVGRGFLYGVNEDGTQPPDELLEPLRINAYRAGGHITRSWIEDGYQYGSATQTNVDSVIAQAERLTQPPHQAQYQAILSDLYGAFGGQPSDTMYPCENGDCSNWISFIGSVVGALEESGLPFAYDIWNEPDIDIFWPNGSVNSEQYFQMWDTAVQEIRRIAPDATIVGPSFAFTPERRPEQWQTWLEHTSAADTVPDMIANHTLGEIDDPVTVGQATLDALSANGIPPLPLSANEYQPQSLLTANVTAWYLARLAQSDYTNAMRANWDCCLIPNLTGILTETDNGWEPTGNWWVMRAYADLTGTLVTTSGQVGNTAISAAEDSANERAVAIVGDSQGYTGTTSVTFDGLASVPWLADDANVHVTVQRIPEQAPLTAPEIALEQDMSVSDGSVTVPLTFQDSHDAFAIYLTPPHMSGTA